MPNDFSNRTVIPRFVRCISGTVFSSSSFENAHFVYSLKALPGPTRPARPALWLADAREHCQRSEMSCKRKGNAALLLTGTTIKDDIPVRGLYEFCLTNPGSMTKTTPSIVIDVSAMFVASTTFLAPSGVGSKILACISLGKLA